MRYEKPRQPGDFFKAQQGSLRQKSVVLVEHLAWHAVTAAKVAPVRDADTQVTHRPAQRITEQTDRRCPLRRNVRYAAGIANIGQGYDFFDHGVGLVRLILPIAFRVAESATFSPVWMRKAGGRGAHKKARLSGLSARQATPILKRVPKLA